jgi:hypothetical protein
MLPQKPPLFLGRGRRSALASPSFFCLLCLFINLLITHRILEVAVQLTDRKDEVPDSATWPEQAAFH